MTVSEYKKVLIKGRISASSDYERLALQGKAYTCYAMILDLRVRAIDELLAKMEGLCDNSIIDDITYEVVA